MNTSRETPAAPPGFNPSPRRPAWGVRVPVRKWEATRHPILVAPAPARVVISLAPAGGPPARALVSPGQAVLRGEPVGESTVTGGPRIHASIAGRVVAVARQPVAGLDDPVPAIVIEGDGTDTPWPGYDHRPDPESLDGDRLRALLAEAGIVGLGGALFPTAFKLAAPGVSLLLLNGAECEPYISCDDLLLRERAGRVVAGARIMQRALGAERAVIALKTDMVAARVAVLNAIEAAGDPRLALSVVTARYPAGGERQLIELVTDREVPSGGLPADVGVICQNVATAAAVADFFATGEPLIRRIVTVCGGAVVAPRNIEARVGTPVRDLVDLAGGYQADPLLVPRRIIMGGPMMGVALPDDGLPITLGTNCLIAATTAELGREVPELPCIRCGNCGEVCPARLQPQELLLAARHASTPDLERLGVVDCIECGACDYVCPSRIPLTRQFQVGKALVADQRYAREQAARAEARYQAREARLARERAAEATGPDRPGSSGPGGTAPAAKAAGAPGPDDLAALLAARQDPRTD